MKLERHVGGLSKARKLHYLRARGWEETAGGWTSARTAPLCFPLARAVHHQLTDDLCQGLAPSGWRIVGYSPRGYAKLQGPDGEPPCSLPKALRIQARREQRPVAELTYSLFLAALLDATGPDGADEGT